MINRSRWRGTERCAKLKRGLSERSAIKTRLTRRDLKPSALARARPLLHFTTLHYLQHSTPYHSSTAFCKSRTSHIMSSPTGRRSARNSLSATPRRNTRNSQPVPSSPLVNSQNQFFSDDADAAQQTDMPAVVNGNSNGSAQTSQQVSSPLFFRSSSIANSDGDRTPRPNHTTQTAAGGE